MPETRFRVNSPPVVLETVDEETIVVNLDSGNYYDLNHVGSHVLQSLARGAGLSAAAEAVARRYGAPASEVAPEVERLVAELLEEGILTPATNAQNGAAGAAASEPVSARPYEPPRLGKFTDMQELLVLDPVHEVDEAGWPNKI